MTRPCRHCALAPATSTGLCGACYIYRRRNGTDRPVELIARAVEREEQKPVVAAAPWRPLRDRVEEAYRDRVERLRREGET